MLDDYGTFVGETEAVDVFIMDNYLDLTINKSSISHISAYIIR